MKKTLATLLACGILAAPVCAQNIGEAMPKPAGKVLRMVPIRNTNMGAVGLIYMNDGAFTGTEIYRVCNESPEAKPFGVYIHGRGVVYIDEDRDGITDEVYPAEGRMVQQDMPPCPTPF